MTPGLAVTEATWDPAKKTMNGTMDTPDGSGGTVKIRSTVEYSGPASACSRCSEVTGPDGKEMNTMRITYTKRPRARRSMLHGSWRRCCARCS